jgi:hypothetical protein
VAPLEPRLFSRVFLSFCSLVFEDGSVVALGFLLGGEFDEVLADKLGNGSLVGTGLFEAVADGFGSSWAMLPQYGVTGDCITLDAVLTLLAASGADPAPATGPAMVAVVAAAAAVVAAISAEAAEAGIEETVAPVPAASDSISTVTVAVADAISLLVADAVSCTETVSLVATATIGDTTGDDSSIVTVFVSLLG